MEKPYISSTILSRELDVPASTIRAYRNKHGVFTKEVFNPPADEFIEKYTNRKSTKSLASFYNVDHHVITKYAKKLGVYVEPKKLLDENQIQEIIDCYETNTSAELASKYHVSQSRITQIWTKAKLNGKPPRSYHYNEHYFENIDSYDKAYFLGFIGSDGCVFYPKDTRQSIVKICIQKQDIKILELFKEKLNSDKPIYVGDYATFEVSSDIMANDLYNLGLSNRKTYDNCIANIDDKFMPHLLRGYFDGDGHVSNIEDSKWAADVRVQITGYEKNMKKIQDYLNKKNIFTSFVEDKRKYNSTTNDKFGNLVFTNHNSKYCFLKLIYENKQDCYMDRKYKYALNFFDFIENSDDIINKQVVTYYKYAVCGVG